MSRLANLRRLFGSLDLNMVKNALNFGKRAFNILHDVKDVADKNNLDVVSNITKRILENKYSRGIEKGLNVGNQLVGAVEQSRSTGLFNRPIHRYRDLRVILQWLEKL